MPNLLTAKPTIATSILPVQIMVDMITDGSNTPPILISQSSSIHHLELRYKQVKQIKAAEIIFIISQDFETDFYKNIDTQTTKVIELINAPNITIYNNDNLTYKSTTKGFSKDYHIWLDPLNVVKVLEYIAYSLGDIYPDNQPIYTRNLNKHKAQLEELDKFISKELKDNKAPLMFAHNGWQYFIKRYNLNYLGAMIIEDQNHNHSSGFNLSAKSISELNTYISEKNISCILSEPDYSAKSINSLINNTNVKVIEINPIENHTPFTKDYITTYFDTMKNNVIKIKECLA
jgi:zinc transport system substrate-binding protein